MLLRRAMEHVKAQNWTAVGLDFLIVVLGVFIGLQVSNWNDARHNEARKDHALDALQIEFEQNIVSLQSILKYLSARNELEREMIAALTAGAPSEQEKETIAEGFTQILYLSYLSVRDSAYESMKQSGDIALINDQNILMALNDYAKTLTWTQEQRVNFRDGINRLAERWRVYVFHSPTDNPVVTAVEIDLDGIEADRAALSAVAEVVRMKSIFVGYIPPLIDRAVAVCQILAAETGRPCAVPDDISQS